MYYTDAVIVTCTYDTYLYSTQVNRDYGYCHKMHDNIDMLASVGKENYKEL